MEALPDLGLPAGIETLDGGLESGFSRWGKDGGDTQAQTKPNHAADAIGESVVSLEAGVIVELGISRKAQDAPVLAQGRDDFGGWDISIRPGACQSAVKRDRSEHIHMNAALYDQVFDNVEAIELAGSLSHIGQIPPRNWWPTAHPSAAIESAAPLEDPADCAHRRDWADAPPDQLAMDGRSPVFAEHTGLFEITANCQHEILNRSLDASRLMGRTGPIVAIQLSQRLIPGSLDPVMDGSHTNLILPCDASQGCAMTGSSHHGLSPFSLGSFFLMVGLLKSGVSADRKRLGTKSQLFKMC